VKNNEYENKIIVKVMYMNNEIMAYIKDGIKSGKNRSWPNCSYFLYLCLKRLQTKKVAQCPGQDSECVSAV
jgi:hypothetical protein